MVSIFNNYDSYLEFLATVASALPSHITTSDLQSEPLLAWLYQEAWDARTNGFSQSLDLLVPKLGVRSRPIQSLG